MNTITPIATDYLRGSRTIETVLVAQERKEQVFFIYNFEGISFRVFNGQVALLQFFQNGTEPAIHYTSEAAVDAFLETVVLDQKGRFE